MSNVDMKSHREELKKATDIVDELYLYAKASFPNQHSLTVFYDLVNDLQIEAEESLETAKTYQNGLLSRIANRELRHCSEKFVEYLAYSARLAELSGNRKGMESCLKAAKELDQHSKDLNVEKSSNGLLTLLQSLRT